jgi:hypothetical protein
MLAFLFWFLITIAVLAIVIIGAKWLLSLAGVTIPAPLMAILGIILFIVLMIALWHFVGTGLDWGVPRHVGAIISH